MRCQGWNWGWRCARSGYEAAAQHFSPDDLDVQVSGRAFLVTGANSGLGKATALEIAKRGGTVHLVCRDAARSEAAQTEILRESGNQLPDHRSGRWSSGITPGGAREPYAVPRVSLGPVTCKNIFLHIVDLSDPKEIWKFVENFKQEHTLNVLINNAGCMVNKREITEDGLEKNFATNTLGVYILTVALIPVLEKAQDPRVVTVSSGGMLVQKLSTCDLQWERAAFDGTMVYAQNKRQQVVMTEQWARVHPAIHFSAMHPGWADTPGVRQAMPGFHARFKDRLRTAAQGADTVLWLALAAAASKQPSGLFFQDRKPVPKHLPLARTSSSPAEEERFMEILDEMAQRFR